MLAPVIWAASLAVGTAVWLAVGWIDAPPDSTCGTLVRIADWRGVSKCEGPMTLRAVEVGVELVLAAVLAFGALVRRRRPHRPWMMVAAASMGFSILLLVLNESVRRQGLFNH